MVDKVSFLDLIQIINKNIVQCENHNAKCQTINLDSELPDDPFIVNTCIIHLKEDMSQNVPLSQICSKNNQNESDNNLIVNKITHKDFNDQINKIQNDQNKKNSKLGENGYFTSIDENSYKLQTLRKVKICKSLLEEDYEQKQQYENIGFNEENQSKKNQILGEKGNFIPLDESSYRLQTLRKGKINTSLLEDCDQKQQYEQQNIGVIYENEFSMVDLKFDMDLNKFVVTKENKGEKEEFEKEYNILQQLKGTNLTLDITSAIQNDQQFQQLAGKTNLSSFNQKKQKDDYFEFELFFFILLEKLNKLHEKGIAHSDIKPQNIVISYENEPYFIDFGGSINISDENQYQFYLNQYSPNFNLQKYLDKKTQFKNKEEIMLCDRTQLALTFLYFYCNHTKQFELFKSKKYNELIQTILMQNIQSNQETILSIISRILNDADSNIKKVENGNILKYYFKDENFLQDQFKKSSYIILEKMIFRVQHIDKFNKSNCKLLINPSKIQISILNDLKEYKYISEKYKINTYFEDLNNTNKYLSTVDFLNICEFAKVHQRTNLKIKIEQNFFLNWILN